MGPPLTKKSTLSARNHDVWVQSILLKGKPFNKYTHIIMDEVQDQYFNFLNFRGTKVVCRQKP